MAMHNNSIGTNDFFLIAPELSLAVIGLFVLGVGLLGGRKTQALPAIATFSLLVPLGLLIMLWNGVDSGHIQSPAGFFGSVIIDKFGVFLKVLILISSGILILASGDYSSRFQRYQSEFIALLLFSMVGLMILVSSSDLITLFISLELASLPIAALAAFHQEDTRSTEAGIKFLLLSALSSAIVLYGFAFIYGGTGTITLYSLDPAIPTIASSMTQDDSLSFGSYPILIGIILTLGGLGFKLSIVPFHMWTPDVYEGSPTPISAFLAVVSKTAAFALLLRVFYLGFGTSSLDWVPILAVLSALSMSVGNLIAIVQRSAKRLLAYSTIAHAGYMLIGVAAINQQGLTGTLSLLGASSVLFYLVSYAAMTLAAFITLIAVTAKSGSDRIEDFAGLLQRSPLLTVTISVALISLTGIPPTAGFIGKLLLFNAAINAGLVWLALLAVINSVVSAYIYLRIVRIMFMSQPDQSDRLSSALSVRFLLVVLTVFTFWMGIFPNGIIDLAKDAALTLLP